MWYPPRQKSATLAYDSLQGYVSDLELEIDRLRKQSEYIQHAALDALNRIKTANETTRDENASLSREIESLAADFAKVLEDIKDPTVCERVSDQVLDFELRPVVESIFRWHQRFLDASHVKMNFELRCENITWFPIRLRHVLDNLISNAIKFRDPSKGETRLTVVFTPLNDAYELSVIDNGIGIATESPNEQQDAGRSLPFRPLGTGVGLAVVRALVEQSGGTLTINSTEGKGTSVVVMLPRFDIDDCID